MVLGSWNAGLGGHRQLDTSSFRAEKMKATEEPRGKEIAWATWLRNGTPGTERSPALSRAATHIIPERLTEVLPERTQSSPATKTLGHGSNTECSTEKRLRILAIRWTGLRWESKPSYPLTFNSYQLSAGASKVLFIGRVDEGQRRII